MVRRMTDSRAITATTLANLLARLHSDPEQAALEYERLRRALVKFFDWRGAWPPDECADEALDRLARRLAETDVNDVRHYAYGIARLVLLEHQRQPVFSSIDYVPEPTDRVAETAPEDGEERLRECFDRCLAATSDESRSLVVGYYEGERQAKISNRRRLAAALSLSESALRNRVQRLRDQLARCVHACVSATKEEP